MNHRSLKCPLEPHVSKFCPLSGQYFSCICEPQVSKLSSLRPTHISVVSVNHRSLKCPLFCPYYNCIFGTYYSSLNSPLFGPYHSRSCICEPLVSKLFSLWPILYSSSICEPPVSKLSSLRSKFKLYLLTTGI